MALLTNMTHWWALTESSGNRSDSHASATLTDTNTVGSESALGTTVALFDDANVEYLVNTSNPCGSPSTGTYSLWARLDDATTNGVYYGLLLDGTDGDRFLNLRALRSSTTKWYLNAVVNFTGGAWESNTGELEVDTWYHIVLSYTSAPSVTWYINTSSQSTSAPSGSPSFPTMNLFGIGRSAYIIDSSIETWKGGIGQVGHWSAVLDSDQRSTLYGSGTPPAYPFGEGAGPTPGSIWPTVTM